MSDLAGKPATRIAPRKPIDREGREEDSQRVISCPAPLRFSCFFFGSWLCSRLNRKMPLKWFVIGSSIVLAMGAAITGLNAAQYWLRASQVPINPAWRVEPGEQDAAHRGWMARMLQASIDSANLNAKAARWTAVSVVLTVTSAIVGALTQL